MTLNSTVRVAIFSEGQIQIKELDLPQRKRGEIDVAIEAAAICGSDLHTVLGHRHAPTNVALGHEGMGRVVGVDEGATDQRGEPLAIGDRVVFALFSACGHCDRCRSGLDMKCRSLFKYGHESIARPPHASGTLATHTRLVAGVPILLVPEHLSAVHMVSAGCSVATAAAVVRALDDSTNDRVLILGAGAVGTYCAALLTSKGRQVSIADPLEARLTMAKEFGATVYEESSGEQFAGVVEASGNATAFEEALRAVDIGGTVVAAGSVSPGSTTVTFDPATIVTKRVTVVGVHNYSAEDFVNGGRWLVQNAAQFRLERLLSPPYALADITSAFGAMERRDFMRALVVPELG